MSNKHEAREPGTKPAVWARSEPGTPRFYAGPGWPGTNKRARLGQETRHGGLARHDPFTSKPVKPAFRPTFSGLGPLRAGLEQEIEPACLDGTARFSNRAWRDGPKTGRAARLTISSSRHADQLSPSTLWGTLSYPRVSSIYRVY
jgi:hypothetical protein